MNHLPWAASTAYIPLSTNAILELLGDAYIGLRKLGFAVISFAYDAVEAGARDRPESVGID
jgi:hypothetical protein